MMAPSKPAPNSEILENLTLSQSPTKPRKTTSRQDEDQEKDVHIATEASTSYRKDIRFWAILFALCITSLLASLETTVVVTSLPTIVERLKFGSSYVWVGNIFFLTRSVGASAQIHVAGDTDTECNQVRLSSLSLGSFPTFLVAEISRYSL